MIAIQTVNLLFTSAGLLLLGGAACAALWMHILELRERLRLIEASGGAQRVRQPGPGERSPKLPRPGSGEATEPCTGAQAPAKDGTLPTIAVTEGVIDRLVSGIKKSLSERGEQEVGWALVGTIDGDGGARVIRIRGLIDEGPGANYSGGHHTADRDYQQRELNLLQILDATASYVGDAHLHPGAMDRPSAGDYRTDLGSVRTSRSKELVFIIATVARRAATDAAAGKSLWRDGLKLDFYYLGCASGYEYRHVRPEVIEGPAMSIPGALRRFAEAHHPARFMLDLENLRRLAQYSMSIGELADGDGPSRLYIRMSHRTLGFNVAILGPTAPGEPPEVLVEDGPEMMEFKPPYLSASGTERVIWFTSIVLDVEREIIRRRGAGGRVTPSAVAGAWSPPPAAQVLGTAYEVQP